MLKSFEASGKSVDEALDRACLLANRPIEELEIEIIDLGAKGLFGIGGRDARVRVSFEAPDAAPAPSSAPKTAAAASTFGVKKSKKERFEQKKPQSKPEFEIKPIVTVDPSAGLPEELKQAADPAANRPERRDKREYRDNRDENRPPRSGQRSPRPERSAAARAERPRRESHATPVLEGEMAEQLRDKAMAFLDPLFAKMNVAPQLNAEVREGILWLCFSGENLGILIGRRGETLNSLQYLANLAVNKQRNDHVRLVLDVEGYRQGREETLAVLAHKMADKAVKSGRRVELEPMNPHERRVVHIALQNDRRVDTASHGEEPYRRVVISKRRGEKK